ncbi:putative ribonuclease H-like domain-containing protein [Tanacetum coccineum]|uniref:Ribonuclease H-like domain-containing protein n=1 Tax=Tanacetum coccineum TaxID=301880 RepID=A0ABQ5FTN1_9ASTR
MDDGYCNGGNLPETYIIRNQLHYQDLEWYEALEDSELKDEILRNKAIMEGFIKKDDDETKDRFKKVKGYHVVPPPYLGNYIPSRPDLSFAGFRRLVLLTKNFDFHENKMVEKSVLNNKGRVTGQREVRPVWNNAQRVNHQNKLTHPHPKRNFVPTAVTTKSRLVPVNAAKQSSLRAATSISTARPVNTASPKPKVNDALQTTYSYFKAHSLVTRPFNQKSAAKTNNCNEKVNTAKVNNVTTVGLKAVVSATEGNRDNVGNLQYALHDQGIFDSGCSRHMTGTKSYLSIIKDMKNRVLVTKPHNKTPYELLHGRPPSISFMKPSGCPVTILNTLDPLGKFDEKADEGFFVGYSINSKAFRVFNTRTRKVEENLHITFLENKPNVAGSGPDWLFDIDLLTNSMNCEPVTTRNQNNKIACIKDNVDVVPTQQYILLPLLYDNPQSSEDAFVDDAGKKTNEDPAKEDDKSGQGEATNTNSTNRLNTVSLLINTVSSSFTTIDPRRERGQRNEFENVFGQDKDANGNSIYRMFTPINAARSSCDNLGGSIPVNVATLPTADLPNDPLMPDLEDTSIFSSAYDDEDVGAEADLNNLETTMNVSPIPTTRIYKDHPKEQIIGDPLSAPQTRRMTKSAQEHAMVSYIKRQRRTNHKDYQNCLFAYFLSQIEPKKVTQTLTDPSWIEAMQDELLQNKKDERGIVVRNKARLVAQGYTQKEGIDYDEVFAPIARIKAIRLFLAYASFMGFIVYKMDVKSAFLYGTIEEEVYVCQPPGFEDPQFPDKVYKVEKALYGLHQSPKAWTKMSSMGELTFFLGLQVKQKDDGIFICQDKYVADILKKFDFVTVKTTSIPIETNKALLKDEEAEDVDVHLYRSMIGSLMYLTASRPDIMFVVCACARFQVTPQLSHFHDV